jgi:N-acetylneuraminic acid mutarotase
VVLTACGGSAPTSSSTTSAHATRAATGHRSAPPVLTRVAYRGLYQLPAGVQDPAFAAIGAGRFVLMGGLTPQDTSSDQVIVASRASASQAATLPNRQHDAQAATIGGRVYLFGGGQFSEYDHILAYDTASHAVTPAGTLPAPSSDVAVAGDGSHAYIVGGYDGTRWLDTVLAFTPGTATPRVVAHLPHGLRYASAVMAGGRIIVVGGSLPDGTASRAVLAVTPATGQVRQIGLLPSPLTHAAAATLDGRVIVVGGRGADTTSRTDAVLAVNPATGAVKTVGRLPTPLSDPGVVALGGAVLVAGGHTADATSAAVGELTPAR